MQWRTMEDAPKDGTPIWGYLYDSGLKALRWNDDIEQWVETIDEFEEWAPSFWLPLEAIPLPPNVVFVHDGNIGRYRDVSAKPESL